MHAQAWRRRRKEAGGGETGRALLNTLLGRRNTAQQQLPAGCPWAWHAVPPLITTTNKCRAVNTQPVRYVCVYVYIYVCVYRPGIYV